MKTRGRFNTNPVWLLPTQAPSRRREKMDLCRTALH